MSFRITNPVKHTLYIRKWRDEKEKKKRLEVIRKRKERFFIGYWEVAGKFFKVKSCLDPKSFFYIVDSKYYKPPIQNYAIPGYYLQTNRTKEAIGKICGRAAINSRKNLSR